MRILLLILFFIIISCTTKKDSIKNPVFIEYSLINSFPHDKNAFTQGLVIHEGELFESTGGDSSWIGVVNVKTGMVDKKIILDEQYFGEGIAILNNKIYQLTWQNHKGFVYDLRTFKKISEFKYANDGWGLTHNNRELIMSNGTSSLYFMDTVSLTVTKTMPVKYQDQPVVSLNELEYIDGYVYANIWQRNWIARIDPNTGEVNGFLDLSQLAQQARLINPAADVLNGIAWHERTKSLLITGKYWPFIYVLKLKEST